MRLVAEVMAGRPHTQTLNWRRLGQGGGPQCSGSRRSRGDLQEKEEQRSRCGEPPAVSTVLLKRRSLWLLQLRSVCGMKPGLLLVPGLHADGMLALCRGARCV